MEVSKEEDSSGPSSLSSDQASLCVIPDPDDSSEEDGFIYLDKSSLPASLNLPEQERALIVFHSVDEEYPANADIVCQYIRPEGWEENCKDQICLFKVGWVTKNDAIFMLPSPLPSNDPIGQIIIPEKMLPKDTMNLFQFCYMRDYTLLGASTPFQFTYQEVASHGQSNSDACKYMEESHMEMGCSASCTKRTTQRDSALNKPQSQSSNSNFETGRSSAAGKVECVLQPSKEIPQLITAIYKDLEMAGSCCGHKAESISSTAFSFLKEDIIDDLDVTSNVSSKGSRMTSSQPGSVGNEVMNKSCHVENTKDFIAESYSSANFNFLDTSNISSKETQMISSQSGFVGSEVMNKSCHVEQPKDLAAENYSSANFNFLRDEFLDDSANTSCKGSGLMSIGSSELMNKSCHMKQAAKDFSERDAKEDELSHLKQRLDEVSEEKQLFQEQYNSLLATTKRYAEDLVSVRAEKESLNGHMVELAISHKMLCSENTRLNTELELIKQNIVENSTKHEAEKKTLVKQLQDASSNNSYLKEEIAYLRSQIKVDDVKEVQPECMCTKYKKQVDDLTARISDYEVMRSCLEVELEEEIKLGKERDQYLIQLEQVKVNNFQMANNWLASTPNSGANGNTLLEMEENVNSTLEALECALKEMEVLRSRKAAINKANRVLREDFMKKRNEWEERMCKQRLEYDVKLSELQKHLEGEKSSKAALLGEIESLSDQLHRNHQIHQQDVSEAVQVANREIETLHKQKSELDKECTLLRVKCGNHGMEENTNSSLMKNLQEAKEEYTKLYTEKIRIQEKLSRLQQKVKSKKVSRAHQDATSSATPKADFMSNVSSSWRATIDELM